MTDDDGTNANKELKKTEIRTTEQQQEWEWKKQANLQYYSLKKRENGKLVKW